MGLLHCLPCCWFRSPDIPSHKTTDGVDQVATEAQLFMLVSLCEPVEALWDEADRISEDQSVKSKSCSAAQHKAKLRHVPIKAGHNEAIQLTSQSHRACTS